MGKVHRLTESLNANVRVHLGGRETFVTEQLLNRFEVRPIV